MKKAMFTTATVFALVLSAGMSMAGPLGGNSHSGIVKRTISTNTRIGNFPENAEIYKNAAQMDGSNPSTQLPNVVELTIDDGGTYTVIFGKQSGTNLGNMPIYGN
ncbi:hypothetical protein [Phaeobacter sp. C3_T13_0]|uniref:hypothetical protein n=1 Tax=Phaeobacter cretensis TaxID=3342641 RepID=UPI0039BCD46E